MNLNTIDINRGFAKNNPRHDISRFDGPILRKENGDLENYGVEGLEQIRF